MAIQLSGLIISVIFEGGNAEPKNMDIINLLVGFLLGGIIAWVVYHLYSKTRYPLSRDEVENIQKLSQDLEVKLQVATGKMEGQEEEIALLRTELSSERNKSQDHVSQLAGRNEELKNLREKLENQKEDIEKLQEKFQIQFKNLANEILDEKTKKFTDQNKLNLSDILNPLKEKITDFEKKVEQTNKESIARNSALKEQISGLKELNQQITKEAENLTKALKGESKSQGNWGEFILESILEKSGLTKGDQYEVQVSRTSEDGRRLQPDVIVKLPEQKHIIIDSKVSLTAYEKYASADDDKTREAEIKNHLLSIRTHIKGLSEKSYQTIYEIGSLDFVLLFMPIEPAFGLAVQNDAELFNDAYEKNIVIVSPSTLIATLRTIASIWRQENQNRNAQEIARQGGQLYDKFVAFADDLIKVGENLNTTKKNYDQAMNKLSQGKGNLVNRTNKLRELGAKATKPLDSRLLDRANE
jgi:DNA recombination protein RmuC